MALGSTHFSYKESEHEHKYFLFKSFEAYEPVGGIDIVEQSSVLAETYYVKREYAILGCNCGSTIKSRVRTEQ